MKKLLVLLIFLISFTFLVNADSVYKNKNQTKVSGSLVVDFKILEHTDQCLTNCYTIYEIDSNTAVTALKQSILIEPLIENEYKIYYNSSGLVDKYCTRNYNVEYEGQNGSKNMNATWTESYICGKETKEIWIKGFPELKANQKIKVKIEFRKKPTRNVDIIYQVDKVKGDAFAWYNSSWAFCREYYYSGAYVANSTLNLTLTTSNYNYSKSKPDLTDIRILEGSCYNPNITTGELPLYNYSVNTSGESLIFFLAPHANISTYAVYYNNSLAPNIFNLSNTFPYFADDFFGSSFDFSNWEIGRAHV